MHCDEVQGDFLGTSHSSEIKILSVKVKRAFIINKYFALYGKFNSRSEPIKTFPRHVKYCQNKVKTCCRSLFQRHACSLRNLRRFMRTK